VAKASPANSPSPPAAASDPDMIDLKEPGIAALLAWLVPGLGHLYQGRRPKALLFFVCIMGTFLYGLYLGEGRVVYASVRPEDRRLPYFFQVGVGLPALPAVVQAVRLRGETKDQYLQRYEHPKSVLDWFMVPPYVDNDHNNDIPDELDRIHKHLHRYFELGTVYTMIAGLLNLLAIYDAWGGPAQSESVEEPKKKEDDPDLKPVAS